MQFSRLTELDVAGKTVLIRESMARMFLTSSNPFILGIFQSVMMASNFDL